MQRLPIEMSDGVFCMTWASITSSMSCISAAMLPRVDAVPLAVCRRTLKMEAEIWPTTSTCGTHGSCADSRGSATLT